MPPSRAEAAQKEQTDAFEEQWSIAAAIALLGAHDPAQLLDLLAKDAGAFAKWRFPLRVRAFAAAVSAAAGDGEKLLEKEFAGKDANRLRAAAYAAGWKGKDGERFLPALVKLLTHDQALVRAQSLEALCAIQAVWSTMSDDLSRLSADASPRVRLMAACTQLYCAKQPDYAQAGFVALKHDSDVELSRDADLEFAMLSSTDPRPHRAWARNGYSIENALTSLIARLSDADAKTQREAIRHLKLLGRDGKPALPALKRLSAAPEAETARAAADAIVSIESAQ